MKSKRLVGLAGVVLFVLCLSDAFGWDSEYRQGFALSHFVDRSNLIIVGEVIEKEYVTRANISSRFTTDFTIAVEETIKGKPNISKTRVKFMIQGGVGTDPLTGEEIGVEDSDEPKFAVGEKVLLFMANTDKPYYANYPYGKLRLYRGNYGKRVIKDNKVSFIYGMENDKLKPVRMPLDLAVQLSKAALQDKDSMVELESDIKDAIKARTGSNINLSQTLVDRLMREAEVIADRNSESENEDSKKQD